MSLRAENLKMQNEQKIQNEMLKEVLLLLRKNEVMQLSQSPQPRKSSSKLPVKHSVFSYHRFPNLNKLKQYLSTCTSLEGDFRRNFTC